MAIAFRSSTTATPVTFPATSISINKPAGAVAGDVLLLQVAHYDSADPGITVSGFTAIRSDDAGDVKVTTFRRVVDGSEGSSFTANIDVNGSYATAMCVCYSGVDNTTPIDIHGGNTGTSSTRSVSSITTTVANVVGVLFSNGYETSVSADPSGMTERIADYDSLHNFYDQLFASAGATGTKDHTQAASDQFVTHFIGLKPAAGVDRTFNGAPVSQGGVIAGVSGVNVNVTGGLTSSSASTSGVASIIISVNGALVSAASTLAGTLNTPVVDADTIQAAAAAVAGTVGVNVNATGGLTSPAAAVAGAAQIIASFIGALIVGNASIIGIVINNTPIFVGGLVAGNATIAGEYSTELPTLSFSGDLISQMATIVGRYSKIVRDTSDVYLVRPNKHSIRFYVRQR